MNIIEALHLETMKTDGDSIESLFNGTLNRVENSQEPSLESSGFTGVFKKIFDSINFGTVGSYDPTYVDPFKVTTDWLTTKEIVIESPATFNNVPVATILGHVLKSKEAILGVDELIKTYTKHIGLLISDTTLLARVSGLESILTNKNSRVHGVPALRKMVDLSKSSRVKLGRLFMSNSDMNVAVTLLNDVNRCLSKVPLSSLNDNVNRLSELLDILVKDANNSASKNTILGMIEDIKTLAILLSDLSYVISTVDVITDVMFKVHENI